MHGARQLHLLAKPAALRGVPLGRHASTRTQQNRRSTEDDGGDFRPPWVYSGSRFLTYTTIPREAIPSSSNRGTHPFSTIVTLLYCAFLADWGEREHLFMPVSCMLGHLIAHTNHHHVSCADGYRSIDNRFSPYLLKKLLSFEETVDRCPTTPCLHRTRAHEYNESTRMIRSHLSLSTKDQQYNTRGIHVCTEKSSLIKVSTLQASSSSTVVRLPST